MLHATNKILLQMNVDGAKLLDCLFFRFFWVSWKDEKLTMGKGNNVAAHVSTNDAETNCVVKLHETFNSSSL